MGWSSQLCPGSPGMRSQDGQVAVSPLSPAVLGAPGAARLGELPSPAPPRASCARITVGHSSLCLCQERDLPPDELRRLQTPRPPTGPVPAPGGSSESQDSHARALRCGDQEGKARSRWGQLIPWSPSLLQGLPPVSHGPAESWERNYRLSVGIPKSSQSQRGRVQANSKLGFSR